MTYIKCKETDNLDQMLSNLFKLRGQLRRLLLVANTITDLHERVEARTFIAFANERIDNEEFRLNCQFHELAELQKKPQTLDVVARIHALGKRGY